MLTSTATAVASPERERPSRSTWLAFQEIRLLACPRCGAPNSAARWQCARCGETFDDRANDEPSVEITPSEDAAPVQPESAPWVALITVVVGVAAVAVAVAMLASRGVGPFGPAEADAPVSQAARATVAEVRTSTTAADSTQGNIADGDPATAWRTDGDGARQWVELRLESAVHIDHLLVWNGDQSSNRSFTGTDRVRDVVIVFPDAGKQYTATFPDRNANFRVDMPDPPVARRIRILVESVYGTAGQAALSEVEALVNSSTAPAE